MCGLFDSVVLLSVAAAMFYLWRTECIKRLGGVTGDCMGALVELQEVGMLLILTLSLTWWGLFVFIYWLNAMLLTLGWIGYIIVTDTVRSLLKRPVQIAAAVFYVGSVSNFSALFKLESKGWELCAQFKIRIDTEKWDNSGELEGQSFIWFRVNKTNNE